MNTTSRYITGIIGLVLGTFLIIVSSKVFIGLIYGLTIFIISAIIIFNKKEDSIEQIKDTKSSRKSK